MLFTCGKNLYILRYSLFLLLEVQKFKNISQQSLLNNTFGDGERCTGVGIPLASKIVIEDFYNNFFINIK